MHRCIELFLNGVYDEDHVAEMDQFIDFLDSEIRPRGWVPFRTEWSIFSEAWMVAGQIDSLWIDPATGALHMMDWKRCRADLDPADGARFQRFGKPPADTFVDNAFSHYAVQQNLYSAILERHYGMHLESMWLVQLHAERSTYAMIEVPSFPGIANQMLSDTSRALIDPMGGGFTEWEV